MVLSTANVTGGRAPSIHQITHARSETSPIDRAAINAWEDENFVAAVQATGRRKLIMVALWIEVCLLFPAPYALREGFEVYPVVKAVAGASAEAHRAGIERIVQAGGVPVSWIQFACKLQWDWAREETVAGFAEIVFAEVGH